MTAAKDKNEKNDDAPRRDGTARQVLEAKFAELSNELSALRAGKEHHLQEARNHDALVDQKAAEVEDVRHALEVLQKN